MFFYDGRPKNWEVFRGERFSAPGNRSCYSRITFYSDEEGFNGFGMTFGPGLGFASVTSTNSVTLSIRSIAENIPDEIYIPIPLVPSIPLY